MKQKRDNLTKGLQTFVKRNTLGKMISSLEGNKEYARRTESKIKIESGLAKRCETVSLNIKRE